MEDEKLFIRIPRVEYDCLEDDARFLEALHAVGVDNWIGYYVAVSLHEESK